MIKFTYKYFCLEVSIFGGWKYCRQIRKYLNLLFTIYTILLQYTLYWSKTISPITTKLRCSKFSNGLGCPSTVLCWTVRGSGFRCFALQHLGQQRWDYLERSSGWRPQRGCNLQVFSRLFCHTRGGTGHWHCERKTEVWHLCPNVTILTLSPTWQPGPAITGGTAVTVCACRRPEHASRTMSTWASGH